MKESIIDKVLMGHVPEHIAIIMDGNGRWAKARALPRIAGHKEGINSVREITRVCGEIGVKHLTLYTFSTENWKRPSSEVSALMHLLLKTIKEEIKELHKKGVRFTIIGDLDTIPVKTAKGLKDGIEITKDNTGLNLNLALNYGSRQEIVEAMKSIAYQVQAGKVKPNNIDVELLSNFLLTNNMPDPELLIRTSGEHRLSNFLLWQIAYTEIFMTDLYWPEFREEQLLNAILDFQSRERRFGNIKEMIRV
jgi:undecaprenyl diphosphate synthase|tara:strand:- start:1172 stop:1921 length:750 start_codon:yes stop_codon:yes gene_type:complete